MKTIPHFLRCAGLLSLLSLAPLFVTADGHNPDPRPTTSGWVSAPDGSFRARTYQDTNGHLVVRLDNRSLQNMTIQMQTLRGEEVAYVPVSRRQAPFAARLDVSELTDGDYRIIIATDTEKVVHIVNLTTPTPPPVVRQATVTLVATSER